MKISYVLITLCILLVQHAAQGVTLEFVKLSNSCQSSFLNESTAKMVAGLERPFLNTAPQEASAHETAFATIIALSAQGVVEQGPSIVQEMAKLGIEGDSVQNEQLWQAFSAVVRSEWSRLNFGLKKQLLNTIDWVVSPQLDLEERLNPFASLDDHKILKFVQSDLSGLLDERGVLQLEQSDRLYLEYMETVNLYVTKRLLEFTSALTALNNQHDALRKRVVEIISNPSTFVYSKQVEMLENELYEVEKLSQKVESLPVYFLVHINTAFQALPLTGYSIKHRREEWLEALQTVQEYNTIRELHDELLDSVVTLRTRLESAIEERKRNSQN